MPTFAVRRCAWVLPLIAMLGCSTTPTVHSVSSAPPTSQPTSQPIGQPAPPPDYSARTETAKIPFTRVTRYDNLTTMSVRVSLNGGPTRTFQVDTGSVGVIVAANEINNVDPNGEPGNITYTSSGVSIDGVWTPVKITFVDSKGPDGKPVSATVPVLAAKSRRIIPGAVNSSTRPVSTQPVLNPKVWMMGVGFGRGAESHQEKNPFVNLDAMVAGTMRRGYTITRDGYTLGLSKQTVGDGYLYEQLKARVPSTQMAEKRPGLKDWSSPSAWVTVGVEDGPRGTALLDTGLTNMMIGRPDKQQADIPTGTPITVHLMGGRLQYGFEVGDRPGPTTPRRVTWTNRPYVYVNTGLRALAVFDYLYDAETGLLGLRPTTLPTTQRATTATTRP